MYMYVYLCMAHVDYCSTFTTMVPSRNILHLMELAFHKEITLQSLQSAKEIGCYIHFYYYYLVQYM